MDSALLRHLGIETVDTPKGFDLLRQTSFACGHGVPMRVSHSILLKEPSLYLSHDLGWTRDYFQGKLDQERYGIPLMKEFEPHEYSAEFRVVESFLDTHDA
jgi:hypothetical protein